MKTLIIAVALACACTDSRANQDDLIHQLREERYRVQAEEQRQQIEDRAYEWRQEQIEERRWEEQQDHNWEMEDHYDD